MVMSRNAVHNRRCSFGLDTWVLMDNALRLGKRSVYDWSFMLDKGSFILCKANKKSPRAGAIRLSLNWPTKDQNSPTGFVTVSHPNWETLPRVVLLAGIPNIDGGLLWRFLCPITRRLVQVVYFDKESQLFVSPAALGCRQPNSDFRRIERHLSRLLQLQHKYGDLQEKPAGMSDLAFRMLKEAAEWLNYDFQLAASGVPEPILNDDGWFDVVAMSKKPVRKASVGGGIYYRDQSGAIKMNARSKKRLGIA
jgi:hypothetical protein